MDAVVVLAGVARHLACVCAAQQIFGRTGVVARISKLELLSSEGLGLLEEKIEYFGILANLRHFNLRIFQLLIDLGVRNEAV